MTHDNTNKGAIWRNKDKQKDTDRDFQGHINIDGVEYWLSGWQRPEGAKPSTPVISFKAQRKDDVHKKGVEQAQQTIDQPAQNFDDFDDDIPF